MVIIETGREGEREGGREAIRTLLIGKLAIISGQDHM
jgi:hypothetical protein